ncbi:tRNA ligase [Saitoella coloradoensis]
MIDRCPLLGRRITNQSALFIRVTDSVSARPYSLYKRLYGKSSSPQMSKISPIPASPGESAHDLITRLDHFAETKAKLNGDKRPTVKRTTFNLPSLPHPIKSWKFDEWSYGKENKPLPTNARGLFSTKDVVNGKEVIVARGYDKFFNVGEVKRTQWNWLESNTKGPYTLTLKENGCIIFMSALPPTTRDGKPTILVTSKHSLGTREEINVSHAQKGEEWLERHLKSVGRTKEQFAVELRRLNATAVAELCDDSFEEHILAYPPERSGLYLHGLNLNTPVFATWSMEDVATFAQAWGMKKVEYLRKPDVTSLRTFLEEAAETGSWNGIDVEGFVIRCKARESTEVEYWEDFFFKYKFEEPYLMYRQWREVTKAIIAGREPKFNKHKAITARYISWAKDYLKKNPKIAEEYKNNHGIIAMRNAFVAAQGMSGAEMANAMRDAVEEKTAGQRKGPLVLVPVSSIGSGKTTVGLCLEKLFGWGHAQNDNNNRRKGRAMAFAQMIVDEARAKKVVFADRNNSAGVDRKQLIGDIMSLMPDARFAALQYVHEFEGMSVQESHKKILEVTAARVFARGDNHQAIQAASDSRENVMNVMKEFLHRYESVNMEREGDDEFEALINLDVAADTKTNLKKVIKKLLEYDPSVVLHMPGEKEIDAAIKWALEEYSPTNKKVVKAPKPKPIKYYGAFIKDDIPRIIEHVMEEQPEKVRQFWEHMKRNKRIQDAFHITLIHTNSSKTHSNMWKWYTEAATKFSNGIIKAVDVHLDSLVWNERVMAIVVRVHQDAGLEHVNKVLHITIGTAEEDIRPVEANMLLEERASGHMTDGMHEIDLKPMNMKVRAEVKGASF